MFEDALRAWDGEGAVIRHDRPTGAWFLVGVHSTVLGPAMGGTRIKTYPSPGDALADVLRLAGAMTVKQAVAGLPYGGGKGVIAVPEVPGAGSEARAAMLRRYAGVLDALGGTYVTAADMNTGPEDMDLLAEHTPHVLGRSPARGGSGDSAPATAAGVFHGIVASAHRAFGSTDLAGRTVLVQGVGAVGGRLARLLHEEGASLLLADTHPGRARDLAAELGATVIDPGLAAATPCDVYSPCATGPVLTRETVPGLRCRVVAGAANNQLGDPDDARVLRDAGVLYAPDFVINAGGVIHLAGRERLGWDEAAVAARCAAIGATLERIYEDADREGTTTADAAARFAAERIEAGPTAT